MVDNMVDESSVASCAVLVLNATPFLVPHTAPLSTRHAPELRLFGRLIRPCKVRKP